MTLKNLGLRMWLNESQLANMGQWVQLGQVCQANGTGCVNVVNAGFGVTANWLGSPCVVDPTHKANQTVHFTTGTSGQTIPPSGGYWDQGFDLGVGRSNPSMDDAFEDDYSKTGACPGGLANDPHFGLYYNGELLKEWINASSQDPNSGGEPCCGGGLGPSHIQRSDDPGAKTGPKERASAVPNLSRDGEPIRFRFTLDRPEAAHLMVFNLTGELVRRVEVLGVAGDNEWEWDLANGMGSPVASGLYLYQVRFGSKVLSGKVIVIR